MSGWVSSWLRGNEGRSDEETKVADDTPAFVPDADEIRRKRMERLAQLEQMQPPPQSEVKEETKVESIDIKTTPTVASVPPTQPKPVSTAVPTPATTNSTEVPKRKPTPNLPRSYINDMLQRILQLTLSPVVAAANDKYLYLQEFATQTGTMELNANHVSEVLYSRIIINPVHLSGTSQPIATLQYLEQCYYRCRDEIQALQSSYLRLPDTEKQVAEECVLNVREMCINYSVTTLTEPEMFPFEVGTLNSEALDKIIRTQSHPLTPEFIEKIALELDSNGQLFPIFAPIFQKILSELFMMHPPSLMAGFYHHFHWITVLCRIKVVAGVLTSLPGFLLVAGVPFTGRRVQDASALGLLLRFSTTQDPAIQEMFTNITKRTKNDVDNSITAIRSKLSTVQNGCTEIFKLLLKAGGTTREQTLVWMEQALSTNAELAKEHPDLTITATNGMMLNLAMVFLQLCGPFMPPESTKSNLINAEFVSTQSTVFPWDVTRLMGNPEGQETDDRIFRIITDFNFITRCYFMTARAIHLGPVAQMGQYMRLLRQISYIQSRMTGENVDPRLRTHFDALAASKLIMDAELLHPDLVHEMIRFSLLSCTVINSICALAANQGNRITSLPLPDPTALSANHSILFLPEHIIEDICTIFIFIARLQPKELSTFPLQELLHMILIFLSSPLYINSPHLRAKMSEVLFYLFLPSEETEEKQTVGTAFGVHLLHTDTLAQEHLAPCLLALYGDVELTGFYEKLEHRYHIACILKYAWKLHQTTFLKISTDHENFIKFAHGLMNHINGLVTDALISLPEIKLLQEEMQDVGRWIALEETVREQKQSLLADKERTVTSSLQLANETIHMMAYLTSEIQEPFIQSTDLEERLASMLSSVLVKLAGPRGIELKVQHPEQYKFRPKEMLHEIVETLLHFAHYTSFQQAIASNGYYDAVVFHKCTQILRRTRLLPEEEIIKFHLFVLEVERVAQELVQLEETLGDIPEEFLDPLMCTLMKDPVLLPTSGKTMDRSTIVQHLMNDPSDPFTRASLTIDQLVSNIELKKKMEEWIKTQQQK